MIELIEKKFRENINFFIEKHISEIDINPIYKPNNKVIYSEKAKEEALKTFLSYHQRFVEDEVSKKNKKNKIIQEIESKITLLIKGLDIPFVFKFDSELNLNSTVDGIRYHFTKYNGRNGSFVVEYKNFATVNVSTIIELRIKNKHDDLINNIIFESKNKTITDIFETEKKKITLKEIKNNLLKAKIINQELEIFIRKNMKKDRLFIYKTTKDFSVDLSSDDPFKDFEIITVISDSSVNYEFLKHLDKIKESLNSLKNKNEITL